jgi:hypothetical protein
MTVYVNLYVSYDSFFIITFYADGGMYFIAFARKSLYP